VGMANQLSAVLLSLSLLNSGIFRPAGGLPPPLKYLNYGMVVAYAAQVLCINEFDGATFSCEEFIINNSTCSYPTGEAVLKTLNMHSDDRWFSLGMVFAMTVLYRFISFVILQFKPVKHSV